MTQRLLALGLIAAGMMLSAVAVGATTETDNYGLKKLPAYTPPKEPWGDPDLEGIWPIGYLNFTPLERSDKFNGRLYLNDKEYAEREKMMAKLQGRYDQEIKNNKLGMGHWSEAGDAIRRTGLLVYPKNGKLPAMTALGKERSSKMRSSESKIQWKTPADFDSWDRCITRGMPASMFPFQYNNGIQIIQAPGYVVIRLEMIHEARIVPLDGRPPLSNQIQEWIGSSRGHWEGNTLVIETTNLKPGPSMLNVGTVGSNAHGNTMPVSATAKITERLTPTGPNSMDYKITYSDPEDYVSSWTADVPWRRNSSYRMYEYACHEGDEAIRDYITSARAKAAQQAKASQAAK